MTQKELERLKDGQKMNDRINELRFAIFKLKNCIADIQHIKEALLLASFEVNNRYENRSPIPKELCASFFKQLLDMYEHELSELEKQFMEL